MNATPEPNDRTTSIEDLKSILREFRDARNWQQFHTPKNLASAISIEAGELMEHFLWKTDEEIEELLDDSQTQKEIRDELADIVCFCINFANSQGIDISQAVINKIDQNNKKYPVEKAKNTAKKYTKL